MQVVKMRAKQCPQRLGLLSLASMMPKSVGAALCFSNRDMSFLGCVTNTYGYDPLLYRDTPIWRYAANLHEYRFIEVLQRCNFYTNLSRDFLLNIKDWPKSWFDLGVFQDSFKVVINNNNSLSESVACMLFTLDEEETKQSAARYAVQLSALWSVFFVF